MDIEDVMDIMAGKATKEFRILDNLRVGGNEIDGVWATTWDDDCLISRNALMEFLRTKENYISLQKRFDHMQQMIVNGALQTGSSADKKELEQARARIKDLENSLADAGVVIESLRKELETARKPDMSEIRALSADVRAKKRDEGFALALSLSIRGHGNLKIEEELGSKGYGTSKASIARALSVTKDGDKQRIKAIMDSHPECFEGISAQDFEKWFSKRYEKLTKAAKIREGNSSWGS